MSTPFRLDRHPRRTGQPLSSPPPGYFERLPLQVMNRVQEPVRPPGPLAWLLGAPAALRTGLASTLLLGTFAASLWLGGPVAPTAATASLDGVSKADMLEYLTNGDTHVDMLDLAELPAQHAALTRQYLRPSASELTQALDEQPADEDATSL